VELVPLLFRLFPRTLSGYKCSRSSVVRFLPWRRALFRSTLSMELEEVDRYGWCPWLLLQLLRLLWTVRGTSLRTRAMGDDGARTRVRIARNSSRTSGERGLIREDSGQ
jgi:hypothetical protein